MIRIYTDGASRGNPGPGGWGFVVEKPHPQPLSKGEGNDTERGGHSPLTTNNKMELQAVIEAFKFCIAEKTAEDNIEIYTDSEYVIKGVNEWVAGWIRRDWKTAAKKPVLNQEYWKELLDLKYTLERMGNTVNLRYVPGHAGVPGNERADQIATSCADLQRPHSDKILF